MSVRYMLAIDIGKSNHVAYIYDSTTAQLSKPLQVSVSQEGFNLLEQEMACYSTRVEDFLVGHEATGHYGQTLLRRLRQQGYELVELNGRQVAEFRRGLGHRAKTDKLDARAMALQLATGRFKPLPTPSPTRLALRRMTRLREDLVQEQTRWLNRLRSLLDQTCPELEAILSDLSRATPLAVLERFPSGQALQEADLAELTAIIHKASRRQKGQDFAKQLQAMAQTSIGFSDTWLAMELQLVAGHLRGLGDQLRLVENEIKTLTESYLIEWSTELGLADPLTIDDFPWGKHIAIGTLLAEIGDVRRFDSIKHLISYLGWCPFTQESSTKRATRLRMSHQGNRFARRMLWMISINAAHKVPEYQAYYQCRLAAGKHKMKTLVAIGRKLLSVFYAILKSGQPYDPQRYLQYQSAAN